MARTWDDTAAVLRDLAQHVPDLARRAAALAVTGQGDGTWLIDARGRAGGARPGCGSTRAPPASSRELDRSGVRDLVYRHTGCGMNACNQSAHLIWLKRHAPRCCSARAATALPLQGLALLQAHRRARAPISPRASSPSATSAPAPTCPSSWRRFGLTDEQHLLPPMLEGSRATHPLTRRCRRRDRPARGPAGGAGLSRRAVRGARRRASTSRAGRSAARSWARPACTCASCADAAGLQLGPEPTGYTMPFPVPGSVTQMQSNMAATLNIDWVVDRAREAAELLGHPFDRKTTLATLDARVLEARPAAALYHPYIHEAGERGPFVDVNARAQFIGLSMRTSFLDLVRAVYEGLAFAARDCYGAMGHVPEEIRARRRRRALEVAQDHPRRGPGRAGARELAPGGRRRRRRHDGRGRDRRLPRPRRGRPDVGDAAAGRPRPPDPALAAIYAQAFPAYVATRKADAAGLGRPRRHSHRSQLHDRDRDHRRSLHAARRFRRSAAPGRRATTCGCARWSCPGPTSRWSTAMPARGSTG